MFHITLQDTVQVASKIQLACFHFIEIFVGVKISHSCTLKEDFDAVSSEPKTSLALILNICQKLYVGHNLYILLKFDLILEIIGL